MSNGDGIEETFHSMQDFRQLLVQFNDSLRSSVKDLENQHDSVSPLWQDQWRKDYDMIWLPFEETMQRYLNSGGPNYIEFLDLKSDAMRRYLFGD
jgi:hypothetical protein